MNSILWHITTSGSWALLVSVAVPFAILFVQYQVDYLTLICRHFGLWLRHGASAAPVPPGERPGAVIVMPTLLRARDELEGIQDAVSSAANNCFPGELTIVVGIDDGFANAALYAELEQWARTTCVPKNVRVLVTCTDQRRGKAVAIDNGMKLVLAMVERGEMKLPPVFFNMDADSELGPDALVRMVDRLTTKSRITGVRPRLITSNVSIAFEHFWFGWRGLFTVKGQIALQVAREYLTAISLGKFNTKIMPVLWASGALYCTWTKLHIESPRWGAFMQKLTLRDMARWWVGYAPPCFATSDAEHLPEAQTGPGDDTWMTWLACTARWHGDELVCELPRTPLHALWYSIADYFVRPVRHEPDARILTRTPTTIKALFKQRIRWNTSRIQDVQRWRPALMFAWTVTLPTLLSTSQLLIVNLAFAVSLLVFPFVTSHGSVNAFATAIALNLFVRTMATLVGLLVDRPVKGNAYKLLALPLAIPYHLVFNVLPTIVGAVQDIFLFGVNTKFSPEITHIRSRTARIALAFRMRRVMLLSIRALLVGDVPLGTFWFGWHETPWTPNGFEGWTSGKKARPIVSMAMLARTAKAPAAVIGTIDEAATPMTEIPSPNVMVVTLPQAPTTEHGKVVSIRPARASSLRPSTSFRPTNSQRPTVSEQDENEGPPSMPRRSAA